MIRYLTLEEVLELHRLALEQSGGLEGVRDLGGLERNTTMEPSWKQADVFPMIARIIEQTYGERQRLITGQEIAARLLQDTAGRNLVQAAHEQQDAKQTLEWLASNMVSWFSQRITVGESEWARAFERTKIDGLWAYKPSTSKDG
jgi:phage I-like protein